VDASAAGQVAETPAAKSSDYAFTFQIE
jgi:hypothetical protein